LKQVYILINLVILRPLSKFKKVEIYISVTCMYVAYILIFMLSCRYSR